MCQARQIQHRFFLLLHLKAYQKQGFFCAMVELPSNLSGYMAQHLGLRKQSNKIRQR